MDLKEIKTTLLKMAKRINAIYDSVDRNTKEYWIARDSFIDEIYSYDFPIGYIDYSTESGYSDDMERITGIWIDKKFYKI